MVSIKISRKGLAQVKQAIAQKGWKVYDDRWLLAASKVLEPDGCWQLDGPYAYGCSAQTWERFLRRIAIRDRSFIAFCQVLALNPQDIAESASCLREDWGEAPEVATFCGRKQELKTLAKWILKDRCRLISIVGLAGMGKTRLVGGALDRSDLPLRLARSGFAYLIWRRLDALPPKVMLRELISFITDRQEIHFAETATGLSHQLLHYLRQHRCLLIFDNTESILQGGDRAGCYREGYEVYGDFFRRVGEIAHRSCVLLLSREQLRDIEDMERIQPVRSLALGGVDKATSQTIFQEIGHTCGATFQGSDADWETLVAFYSGNPLALEVAARHILRRFNGNLSQFLGQNLRVFGKIRDLLNWHFDRLSAAEKEVMYWLAINQQAVSIADLKKDLLSPLAKKQLPETLDTLERQIPLEKNGTQVAIQPVLMEYVTNRLINQICHELKTGKLRLLKSHALVKASAKGAVSDSQTRIMLEAVVEQLRSMSNLDSAALEDENCLDYLLSQILASLKQTDQQRLGYVVTNLINLGHYSGVDMSQGDFSHLAIWQTNLRGTPLYPVSFAAGKFVRLKPTDDLSRVQAIYTGKGIKTTSGQTGSIRAMALSQP